MERMTPDHLIWPRRHEYLISPSPEQDPRGRPLLLEVPGFDVYNCTCPVQIGEYTYIFARVERRKSEQQSSIYAFMHLPDGSWSPMRLNLPFMQDPAIVVLHGEIILSGVRVKWEKNNVGNLEAHYWTEWYTLDNKLQVSPMLHDSRPVIGPKMMKDIRFAPVTKIHSDDEDEVHVFTRPTSLHDSRAAGGRIAYTRVKRSTLDEKSIAAAEMIALEVKDDEWVGANQMIEVDGLLWVLGHVAHWNNDGMREYDAMVFVYDPVTKKCSKMERIATYKNFELISAKNRELQRIIFAGGFIVHDDNTITVYVGLNDSSTGYITIPNPFYELAQSIRKFPIAA